MVSLGALAALLPSTSFAQAPQDSTAKPTPAVADTANRRDPRLDLLRGITLTPAQRQQIDSIDAAFAAAAKRVDDRSNSAAETVIALPELVARRDRAIRSVLTPAQLPIYQRNVDSLRAWARRERHP